MMVYGHNKYVICMVRIIFILLIKINQYDSGTLLILITRLKENNTYAINLLTFIDMLKAWVSPYFSEVTFYHYITFELQNSI